MLYYGYGGRDVTFSPDELAAVLNDTLSRLGPKRKVLVLPPDITRVHSQAGPLTRIASRFYGSALADIMPAIGTHDPMRPEEIATMFGDVPQALFRTHDFRRDVTTLGTVPAGYVREVSQGKVDYAVPIQVNRLVAEGGHDLILSIGQVVPHEVVGMASYNKNVFVGTGGGEGISRTHFLGAAYGMERIMGRSDTPVRRVLNYGSEHFAGNLPLVYILTVIGLDGNGALAVRGLFIGDDVECFTRAATLSLAVNFTLLPGGLKNVVVFLDPSEYRSTWLGNKSIYRTRMAIADGGELIVLAPGVAKFGEDEEIDRLIRKYGYSGTENIRALTRSNDDLQRNLSAAAHLMHGSSDGRFTITYCPGKLTGEEIRGVNFQYGDLAAMMNRYNPALLKNGWNTLAGGEEVFFISNPALGLWAEEKRFV